MGIFLSQPLDVIRCFHNAFRRDITQIDTAILNVAQGGGDMQPFFSRLQIFSEVLDIHARGEEAAVFPAIDKVTPSFDQAYLIDHRELDKMTSGLETISKAPDPLTTARATAVLNSHLRIHLNKEDSLLYPILKEKTTASEQASILNIMSSKVPANRFPTLIEWLFTFIDIEDQVTVTRQWMALMPPQVFVNVKQLIKKSVGENWRELIQQIPGLSDM